MYVCEYKDVDDENDKKTKSKYPILFVQLLQFLYNIIYLSISLYNK